MNNIEVIREITLNNTLVPNDLVERIKRDLAQLAADNEALRKEIKSGNEAAKELYNDAVALRKENAELKADAEIDAKCQCELWDALGARNLPEEQKAAMERIRDLIAAEGELGDVKADRDRLQEQVRTLRELVDHKPNNGGAEYGDECWKCGDGFEVRDGCEAGRYCDLCAQELIENVVSVLATEPAGKAI